jgi:hypothetical protein
MPVFTSRITADAPISTGTKWHYRLPAYAAGQIGCEVRADRLLLDRHLPVDGRFGERGAMTDCGRCQTSVNGRNRLRRNGHHPPFGDEGRSNALEGTAGPNGIDVPKWSFAATT